jgi:hypothetical protein
MALKLRQGLAADRTSVTPATGELIYTTDTKFVYVGDGVTAGGNLISGAVATDINGLSDLVITSESNGQVLKYNGTNWINDTVAGGSSNLDGLTDVVITSASNGQVLKFNGTNWINAAESSGSSFSVSGDDSAPRVISSGGTLSVLGNNKADVYFDEYDNLTINVNSQVAQGVQGQVAFYGSNGDFLEGTGAGLLYDNSTGIVYSSRVDTNAITSSSNTFSLFNTVGLNTIGIGGTLDGDEYSGRIFQVDVGPVNTAAPFSCAFRNVHNSVNVNGILLERSRGTLASETAVQAGDVLHAIIFSGNDGTGQRQAAVIVAVCEATPAPGVMQGVLAFQTQDSLGVNQTAIVIDSAQYVNITGAHKLASQTVDTSSGNATLTRSEVRGNIIYSIPSGSTRTLFLPAPTLSLSGLRLLIINSSSTQSLIVSYTGGSTVRTLTAGTMGEVLTEGVIWFSVT